MSFLFSGRFSPEEDNSLFRKKRNMFPTMGRKFAMVDVQCGLLTVDGVMFYQGSMFYVLRSMVFLVLGS